MFWGHVLRSGLAQGIASCVSLQQVKEQGGEYLQSNHLLGWIWLNKLSGTFPCAAYVTARAGPAGFQRAVVHLGLDVSGHLGKGEASAQERQAAIANCTATAAATLWLRGSLDAKSFLCLSAQVKDQQSNKKPAHSQHKLSLEVHWVQRGTAVQIIEGAGLIRVCNVAAAFHRIVPFLEW